MIALRESECCALARTNYRSITLRRRASRPQPKRDPLGGYLQRLLAVAALILSGCSREEDRKPPPPPAAQRISDPSADTLLITADRIGRGRSCALLSEIHHSYPGSRDTLTPTEDPELKQAGVVVDLAPGERLLYVASWSDSSHAWTLSTTSPRFHTRRGLHVGSMYAEFLSTGDSIDFSLPEGQVVATIIPDSVSFMVDDRSATKFYNRYSEANLNGGRQLMDSNARIVEFFAGRGCGR